MLVGLRYPPADCLFSMHDLSGHRLRLSFVSGKPVAVAGH